MNKAMLVALREYMENLKTKTFWLGIMMFPVILALSFAVPYWLEKEKDVRHYAVLDYSELSNGRTLLGEVEKRSAMPDMEILLTESLEKYENEKKKKEFEELPKVLQDLVSGWSSSIDEMTGSKPAEDVTPKVRAEWQKNRDKIVKKLISKAAEGLAMLEGPEGEALLSMGLQMAPQEIQDKAPSVDQVLETLKDFKKPIQEWWQSLPPEEADKYGSRLSKSRYARVEVDLVTDDPEEALKEKVKKGELFAYFVVGKDPVGKDPKGKDTKGKDTAGENSVDAAQSDEIDNQFKYVSMNLTDKDLKNWFTRYANEVVKQERIDRSPISKKTADWLKQPLKFEAKQISEAGEEEEVAKEDTMRQWAPVGFVYLLWISVFMVAQMLLTNTVEEKSNKIMEVLLSSVSPIQLMAGKIIGIAGTGLTMVLSWVIFFLLGIKIMPLVLGHMPDFDLSIIVRDPVFLCSFLAYFILGYLLLAAILVGIGAVCNSLKEAQNLMGPVTIIMIVPLMAMVPISQDPNGAIAKAMSYIPPFTPFVMMNRAAGPPSTMEYVVTTALLLVSIALALWAAAKVFRIGILMTGKPPKLLEILKWLRAPVGQVHVRKEE